MLCLKNAIIIDVSVAIEIEEMNVQVQKDSSPPAPSIIETVVLRDVIHGKQEKVKKGKMCYANYAPINIHKPPQP